MVTSWREGASYRLGTDQLSGYVLRRRTPIHIWLFETWYWRAHGVPLLRRLVHRDDWWCVEISHWLEARSDQHRVYVDWDELSPDYRAKYGARWERRRARWQRRRAEGLGGACRR